MPIVVALMLLSFLQSALIPFNLVFLVIITRSFITAEKTNYWLAFWFGILLSLLIGLPLGPLSIIYLLSAGLVQAIKKAQFASHWAVILPLSVVLLFFDHGIRSILMGSSFAPGPVLVQSALVLPVYFIVRVWEERFIPRAEIRLKVGK